MLENLEQRHLMSVSPLPVPLGSAKLTGAIIGTAGSYKNQGNTIANAFDGNINTFFDGPTANGDWVGLNLGTAETITQVQFVPRSGFASRMVGGVFQGSNTADFSSGVTTLFTISSTPALSIYTSAAISNLNAFEFVRYLAPANAFGNVAELEFDGATVAPTAPPLPPSAPVATATSNDVHLNWTEDPSSVVSSYTVERQGPTDATYMPVGTTNAGVTSYDDTTVAPSSSYSYEIVANNSLGSVASDPTSITTPAPFINHWTDLDIGSPAKTGSATVSSSGPITVSGGGADIWNDTDQFNYEYQPFVGNGSITAQVTSQSNTSTWAKSGIMIRETTNTDSRFVMVALTPGNGIVMQARTATHSTPSYWVGTAGTTGVWLQLKRSGSVFTGYVSTNDSNWTLLGSVTIPMINNADAGLAVTAHDNTKLSVATFSNVAISTTSVQASPWTDSAPAPMTRWESQTFTYNGDLYVFGGYIDTSLDSTAECDVYDPVANKWSYVTTIPTGPLAHAATTLVGDTVYFAGGDIGRFTVEKTVTSTSQVLTYDITTGVWGSVASLPAPLSCGGLVCINNTLYYYGGFNATDSADLSNTWSLDLGNPNATWVAQAPMPNARNHLGYAAINGIAYAIGGDHLWNTTNGIVSEVDAYNPATNTWTKLASLPIALTANETSTIVVNGKIVVVGGDSNGGYDGIYQNTIFEYNPVTNIWTEPGTLPEANSGPSPAYLDNELIVADGTVDNRGGFSQDQTWIDTMIQL